MGGPRVFIVEDDDIASEILESFVRHFAPKAEVRRYGNGRDALDAVHNVRPNLVFLDYMMPVMDGMEFLRRLRNLSDLPRPYVAVVSAFVDSQRESAFYEVGADTVLTKPLDIAHVGGLLARLGHA